MLKFAANLSLLFTEAPFLQRFERAAAVGFRGVECLFPYTFDAADLARELERNGLEQVLINAPPGDWNAGDRGTAALPSRREEFRRSVETALAYARRLGCRRVHVMAGVLPEGADRSVCERTFVANLQFAADKAATDGITILVEALNDRDVPGYLVEHQSVAMHLVRAVDRPNVAVQLDYYHAQIMDGDLTRLTETLGSAIGHVQVSSVPDRREPDHGEIHFPHLFEVLERIGYDGWIGCEYHPRGETEAGLGWLRPYT